VNSLRIPLFLIFQPVHLARLKTSHPTGSDSCQMPDFSWKPSSYSIDMKILIADQHPEVQTALHLVLNRIPDVTGVSEANSMIQLLAQCVQSCPDLILLDLDLLQPSRSHTRALPDLITVLGHICPCSRVVILSSRFESESKILAAGASGFISKTDPPDEVLSRIVRFLESHS
jgi:two-component system, NarL family, invasion response regulator UvrY